MSTITLEIPVDRSTLGIIPWHDEVVDPIGFDPRSTYVELFWLNVLGPTATWLLRRLATGLDEYPGGYELDLDETAGAMGLAYTLGSSNPFMRALNRCVLFGVAQPVPIGLAVRRRVPPVAGRHLQRMPPHLQRAHEAWRRTARQTDVAATERADALAATMFCHGDDPDVVERQLMSLGVSPLAAIESTNRAMAHSMDHHAA